MGNGPAVFQTQRGVNGKEKVTGREGIREH